MKSNAVIRRGRAGIQSSGGGQFVKIESNSHVDIVVLTKIDDFVSYDQHTFWSDGGNSPMFACIGSGSNCPGCAHDNRAVQKTLIPVYDVVAKGVKILSANASIANAIADCAEEIEVKGRAFRIKRKGEGKRTRYSVIMLNKKAKVDKVKVPDLEATVPVLSRKAIIALLAEAGFDDNE